MPMARAVIAGAAFLAGAAIPHAFAQPIGATDAGVGDEVAFAMPRLHSPDGADVALPKPLAPSDAVRIRRIFALQARGDIPAAVSETGKLDDTTLLGAILADRYLRKMSDARGDDLTFWLSRYADQADAPAIRRLALLRLPIGTELPVLSLSVGPLDPPEPEETDPADLSPLRNPALDQAVHDQARAGKTAAALRLIDRTRGLSGRYAGQLRAELAQILLTQNADAEALTIATAGLAQSHDSVGLAAYVAGLAAWRLDRVTLARSMFETASHAPLSSASLRSGAAFWAARTYLRAHDTAASLPWMRRAATEPRTFYGLLARRALGMSLGLSSSANLLSMADVDAIGAMPQGLRAYALLQVGQKERAEAELRALWSAARQSSTLGQALLMVARKAGFTDLAAELGGLLQVQNGTPHDDDRFPIPKLHPRGGFQLDPALVYALARVESNFDPDAISSVGARGLMQLMPETAGYMASGLDTAAFYRERLHDPAVNLQVGQRYVLYLAQHEAVGFSLIHLLASYNAGPGNLQKWVASMHDGGDPLMFIECIPIDETRSFVQHALAYTWIYAARLGLAAPSIDELAAGAWPRFRAGPRSIASSIAATLH